MTVTVVELGETITAGNDYAIVTTLTQDGSTYDLTVGGTATVTCSIRPEGSDYDVVTDHVVAITTGASGIITLTLLAAETAVLQQPRKKDMTRTVLHYADFKVVEGGGGVTNCGPFSFPVRRPIT